MSKFKRKGMSKFKRRWNPTCYVCRRRITELHDMKWLKVAYEKTPTRDIEERIDKLATIITTKVTCVGHYKNGTQMLRHNNGYCEPGGDNYMKNPELAEAFVKFTKGEPEETRWWEKLPNVIKEIHTNV